MKKIKKNMIVNQKTFQNVLNEKKIMLSIKHPFIVQLYHTF